MLKELIARSGGQCELCASTPAEIEFPVVPKKGESADECVLLCDECNAALESLSAEQVNYWRCLNESMWSEVPAVKVLVWRILNHYQEAGWTTDLKDMLYLDEELREWAESSAQGDSQHIDSNGQLLTGGDTVVLIKDLDVKGAGFTAKRGTAVRNIRLVHDNPEHIEGKVNGQAIVILTKYVKKN